MLTEQQIRLYARQVILRELGQAGQARLCASRVAISGPDAAANPEVARVASDYLQRAGLQLVDGSASACVHVALPELPLTGEPALQACAQWLLGAWAAVETIKQAVEVGSAAPAPTLPWTAEVD